MQTKIKLFGEIHILDINNDDTVLDAALDAGLEPEFSCQAGVCGTCKAKLISGKIEMDETDALTDEEIAEGYVLTCQTHPLNGDVFIDFDEQN